MLHVPYKGGGQAISALLAGDVQVAFASSALRSRTSRCRKACVRSPTPAAPAHPICRCTDDDGSRRSRFRGQQRMAGTVRAGGLSAEIVAKLQGEVLLALPTRRCGSGSRPLA